MVNLSQGTGDSLIGDFRYANLASSVDLLAGASYFLAGTTLGDDWVYQASSITMASGFNYLGSYYTSLSGGVAAFPGTSASEREYMTVNALFGGAAPAPVPSPATLALFGLGLAGLGWSKCKKA